METQFLTLSGATVLNVLWRDAARPKSKSRGKLLNAFRFSHYASYSKYAWLQLSIRT